MSEEMLTALVRQSKGKKASRKLRHTNRIPAVLYGAGQSMMLEMDEALTRRYISRFRGNHRLIPLEIVNEAGKTTEHHVLIQEIQQHPYKHKIVHLDFRKLDSETPITVKVPLKLLGTAAGVKKGGIIQMIMREVPVTCLPANIPEFIEVDVSHLDFNESIRVNEINYPESVIVDPEQDYSILTIVGRVEELEETPVETTEEEEEEAEEKSAETE